MIVALALFATVWQADPANCRTIRLGQIGPEAQWTTDGRRALTISTTIRDRGRVELHCRVRVPDGTERVALHWGSATVSFAGATTKTNGSGLILRLQSVQRELIRTVSEDWVQSDDQSLTTVAAGKVLTVVLAAIDTSGEDPMRIDLEGLRVDTMTAHDSTHSSTGRQNRTDARSRSNHSGATAIDPSTRISPAAVPAL